MGTLDEMKAFGAALRAEEEVAKQTIDDIEESQTIELVKTPEPKAEQKKGFKGLFKKPKKSYEFEEETVFVLEEEIIEEAPAKVEQSVTQKENLAYAKQNAPEKAAYKSEEPEKQSKEYEEPARKSSEYEKPAKVSDYDDDEDTYSRTQLLDDVVTDIHYLQALDSDDQIILNKSIMLVGCKPDCDIYIPQDRNSHSVSRQHAYFLQKNEKYYIRDISTNGTFIGEAGFAKNEFFKLPKDIEVEVRVGQVIRFADVRYQFLSR